MWKILLKQKILLTFAAFSLLSSCSKNYLAVHSDYLTEESLASFFVGTPDPLLDCPPFGERLVISWSVSPQVLKQSDPHLVLTLRMRNREQVTRRIAVKRASGTALYKVTNERYCETGGFLTYKVQLFAGGCLHEEWRHQLWAELIEVDVDEEEDVDEGGLDEYGDDAIEFLD